MELASGHGGLVLESGHRHMSHMGEIPGILRKMAIL
jgi:hypothetical protein